MSRTDAKRTLNRLLDLLPTDVLEEITAGMVVPSRRVTALDKAIAGRFHSPTITAVDIAASRQREEAAWLMHRAATALLVDALLVKSSSGEALMDAEVLIPSVMDEAGVSLLRPIPLTPKQRMRRQWDQKRRKATPLVFERDGAVCRYCGSLDQLTIDHLTPIERDGNNHMDNLGVACSTCNSRKGCKTEAEYLAWMGVAV